MKAALAPRRDPRLAPLIVSLLLLATLALLTYTYPSDPNLAPAATDLAFALICLLGLVAAVKPGVLRVLRGGRRGEGGGLRTLGHHPDCAAYRSHTISAWGRTLCAGCTGLAAGSLLALAGTAYVALCGWPLSPTATFWAGFLLTAAGLLQHLIDLDEPLLHAALNAGLVSGVFLLREGTSLLNGGLYPDLLALAAALYWVDARIALSDADHDCVCASCAEPRCLAEPRA